MTHTYSTELQSVAAAVAADLARETFPECISPSLRPLTEAMVRYPQDGGKRLRPAILRWGCQLAGTPPERAAHAALAVELYHNWTLIHDDIIDNDATRRGHPTCHASLRAWAATTGADKPVADKFGNDMAILAGDLLHGWSVDALARATEDGVAPGVTLALVRRLCAHVTPLLISGEALDVSFPLFPAATPDDIRTMMELKTAVLLQFALQAGWLLGVNDLARANFDSPDVAALGQFGLKTGLAFQLWDDYLGMFGDERQLKKPVGSDLREGKQTLLLQQTRHLASAADWARLEPLVGNPTMNARELPIAVRIARSVMTDCGAAGLIVQQAKALVDEAKALLTPFPDSHARTMLLTFAEHCVNRES